MFRMSAREDGASVAPATPNRARAAISIPGLVENAAISDASANTPAPISSSRRRPTRSPTVPIVIKVAAIIKP